MDPKSYGLSSRSSACWESPARWCSRLASFTFAEPATGGREDRHGGGRRSGYCGFTLIEVLIASAIAVLVTAAMFAVYRAVNSSILGISSSRREYARAVSAVEVIGRDLACLVKAPLGGRVFLLLEAPAPGEGTCASVCFHTIRLRSEEIEITRRLLVERTTYKTEMGQGAEGGNAPPSFPVLVRETCQVKEDGTLGEGASEEIASGVQAFEVEVFDGRNWLSSWPVSGGGDLPLAARIRLSVNVGGKVETLMTTAAIHAARRY